MNELCKNRMHELRDLQHVIGLLGWDQETYMPSNADESRAAQLSTMQGIYHEKITDSHLGDWIEQSSSKEPDTLAMLRVLKMERNRALKVPARLVKELAHAQSIGVSAWKVAREKKEFKLFEPALTTLVSLRREQADAFGHDGERYDALLEGYEPGMRVSRLSPVFEKLRQQLVPLVEKLDSISKKQNLFSEKSFAESAQWDFSIGLLNAMGFDLNSGRQDKSTHPFTSGNHPQDIRLTTRIFEHLPFSSVFSSIHEGGHGLYEQGFQKAHFRTTLAQAPSMGLHESQSRLWENIVGRSESFWRHFLSVFNAAHATNFPLKEFMGEVCRVERSLIRVEADEVTYNLHIILRYELELALLRGDLQVKDLEAAWNEKTKKLLGLEVKDVTQGVLQDIHWAFGELGYFPTYTLGNLYAASLFKALMRDIPNVYSLISNGELLPVKTWLNQKIHSEGFRFDAETLVKKVTGHGLTDVDFISSIKERYMSVPGVKL
jgi:carboxypeptidase Taq